MQTRIGPQLVMAGQLLRASTEEIEQIVLRELQENPALELNRGETSPAAVMYAGRNGQLDGWEDQAERVEDCRTAVQQLEAQAFLMAGKAEREIVSRLLYTLDQHGYLRESVLDLAAKIGAAPEQIERAIQIIHKLEPPGIGARDLRECLLLQCDYLAAEGVDCSLPKRILADVWDDFCAQHWGRVARKTGKVLEEIEAARAFIATNLYPYPLRMIGHCSNEGDVLAVPDLVIQRQPGADPPAYRLEIPGESIFRLRLSHVLETAAHRKGKSGGALTAEELDWINIHIERARLFINSLAQRWVTLRLIGEFLLRYQSRFLVEGRKSLRPVTRAAVAKQLGLHESTVSRAVRGKTVQLPDGRLIPLSDLFNAAIVVHEALREVLNETGGTVSDREIAERLKARGVVVARRTVGKYREQLRIPNSHQRQAA